MDGCLNKAAEELNSGLLITNSFLIAVALLPLKFSRALKETILQ